MKTSNNETKLDFSECAQNICWESVKSERHESMKYQKVQNASRNRFHRDNLNVITFYFSIPCIFRDWSLITGGGGYKTGGEGT